MHLQKRLVALLDALGVSKLLVDGCLEFLDKQILLRNLDTFISGTFGKPDVMAFADNIVLTWEKPVDAFHAAGAHLGRIMAEALRLGIALRGAIAHGHYVERRGTSPAVLGPAVSECREYYEKADWLGLIMTPGLATTLDRECDKQDRKGMPFYRETVDLSFPYYRVPLKGSSECLRALDWFEPFMDAKGQIEFKQLIENRRKVLKPDQDVVLRKYANTEAFHAWCWEKRERRRG